MTNIEHPKRRSQGEVVTQKSLTSAGPQQKSSGRRERAKAERRLRLKRAALEVFAEQGYQAATTREIARRAGIGAGTLFRYAEQKGDLLLMIVNDDLDAINEKIVATHDPRAPFVDQLVHIFAPRFSYWGSNLDLAREALHQTVLARAARDTTKELSRYMVRRSSLLEMVADIVRAQQLLACVRRDLEPNVVANLILGLYLAQVRLWLADSRPMVARGVRALRESLLISIEGIGARNTQPRAKRKRPSAL